MTGDVIKSFLVGLGFDVDDASLAKFNKSIALATLKVTALYGSIKATALAIQYSISKISEGFEQMGYEYKLIAPAINKALILRREMLKAYSAAGVNLLKVIQSSVKLNLSLTKTRYAFEAIYKSVASRFFDLLTKQSDTFRAKIYANMPKIQLALERFVKYVFKALEAVTELGYRIWLILTRVYDFFLSLDRATEGWSTIILGVVSAWYYLNSALLATPFGRVIAGILAIIALYDDFKVWQDGGQAFFNWSSFLPVIDALRESLAAFLTVLQAVADTASNVVLVFLQLFKGDFSGAWDSLKDGALSFLTVLKDVLSYWVSLANSIGALGSWGKSLLFGDSAINPVNLKSPSNFSIPGVSPLGSNVANTSSVQNIQQATTVNVQGVPDANGVGKAVSFEQYRANQDLQRNLGTKTQ